MNGSIWIERDGVPGMTAGDEFGAGYSVTFETYQVEPWLLVGSVTTTTAADGSFSVITYNSPADNAGQPFFTGSGYLHTTYVSDASVTGMVQVDSTGSQVWPWTATFTDLSSAVVDVNLGYYQALAIKADAATTTKDTPVNIDALENDLFASLEAVTVTVDQTSASGGSVVQESDGTFTYTPASGFTGEDTFSYKVTGKLDGNSQTRTVTVTVEEGSVTPDTPTAADSSMTVQVEQSTQIDLASLVTGDGVTVTAVSQGASGSTSLSGTTVTYTAGTTAGSDSFTYTVTDSAGQTATGTITVTVEEAPVVTPNPPTAGDSAASVQVNESTTIDLAPLFTGDGVTVTAVSQGTAGGSTSLSGTTVTYTAGATAGADTFTYTVTDSVGQTATGTITVTVSDDSTPTPPTAADGTGAVQVNESTTIDLASLFSGDDVTVTAVSQGTVGGSTSLSGTTVTYTAGTTAGSDTFTYTVTDSVGQTATGTITVTVSDDSTPTPPTAPDATAAVQVNESMTVDLAGLFTGDGVTVTAVSQGTAGGSTSLSGTEVTYTAGATAGTDTFTYTVTDSVGQTATGTITVTVSDDSTPTPPTAADGTGSVKVNESTTIDLASLITGDGVTVTAVSQGTAGGSTSLSGTTVTYTAGATAGTDTFTYTVTDSADQTATGTITVTVSDDSTPTPTPPTAGNASASVKVNESTTIELASLFTGDAATVTAVSQPTGAAGGSTSLSGTTVTYTAGATAGAATFTYTVTDSVGQTATGAVTITVTEEPVVTPDPPVANDGTATVAVNGSVHINLAKLFVGNGVSVTDVTQPTGAGGTLTRSGSIVTFTAGATGGTSTFTYTVTDSVGQTATGTVTVTVSEAPVTPEAPEADDATATVVVNESVQVDLAELISGTDLTITSVTQPTGVAGGSTALSGTKVTYTAGATAGTATFTYTVEDSAAQTATGTITVTVTEAPVVTDPPTAADGTATVVAGASVQVPLAALFTGTGATVTAVSPGAAGGATALSGSTVTYTAGATAGTDTFTYTVTDSESRTATGTITVTVTEAPVVTDPPTAADGTATVVTGASVQVPLAALFTGTGATVTAVSPGTAGGTTALSGSTVTYTAGATVGTDTFTYTVTDSESRTATGTITVTVTEAPVVTDPPTAADGTATVVTGASVQVPLAALFTGTDATVTAVSPGAAGGATSLSGSTVTYTAGATAGTDTFTYTVTDSTGRTATGTITVTVVEFPVDPSKPTAADLALEVPATRVSDIDLTASITGTAVTVTAVEGAEAGAATASGAVVTYTPSANEAASESLTYTVTDVAGQTATATITLTVVAGPEASDDSARITAGYPVVVKVTQNDTIPHPERTTTTVDTLPANGTATLGDDGTITYTPNAGFSGTDTFTYTMTDDLAQVTTATVTVEVVEGPTANADEVRVGETVTTPVTIDVLANDLPTGAVTVTGIATAAGKGVAEVVDGAVRYTPDSGATGTDTFEYQVTDTAGRTAVGTVTVTLVAAPTVTDKAVTVGQGVPVNVAVLEGAEGSAVSLGEVHAADSGTAVAEADATATYTSTPEFSGEDTFTFTVVDDLGQSATGTVTVTVVAAPVADDEVNSTGVDQPLTLPVLDNDELPSADTTTVTVDGTSANGGTVVVNDDGTVTYTPPAGFVGTDTFVYYLNDGLNAPVMGTVTVTVHGAPVAQPDAVTIPQSGTAQIEVLANDEGRGLSVVEDSVTVAAAADGAVPGTATAIVREDGTSVVEFRAAEGFVGDAVIEYTVVDQFGQTGTSTITVTVVAALIGVDSIATTTPQDTPVDVDVLTQVAGGVGVLTVSGASTPANGTAEVLADGLVRYTPAAGFVGQDTFLVTVVDELGQEVVVTVVVDVTAVPGTDDDTTDDTTDDTGTSTVSGAVKLVDSGNGTLAWTGLAPGWALGLVALVLVGGITLVLVDRRMKSRV